MLARCNSTNQMNIRVFVAKTWHDSLIHKACYENDVVGLEELLLTVDIDMKGGDDWTALMVATYLNRIDCVKILLQMGTFLLVLSPLSYPFLFLSCVNVHTHIAMPVRTLIHIH